MVIGLIIVEKGLRVDSLLVSASKYASSDKVAPRENFITEVLAWLSRHDNDLVEEMIGLIVKKSQETQSLSFTPTADISVDTQLNFNGSYPDMGWRANTGEWHLLFEHKVWTELSPNQLQKYRDYAQKHLANYAMILITPTRAQHRQNPDVALCWSEVAQVIEALKRRNDRVQWARDEFLELLTHIGIKDISPINPLAISYYQAAKQLERQWFQLCERLLEKPWPLTMSSETIFTAPTLANARGTNRYDRHGRIVFNFGSTCLATGNTEQWLPGLGMGFILDGDDLNMAAELKEGPVVAAILSVNQSLHSHFQKDGHYRELVNEITEVLLESHFWKVFDGTSKTGLNKWHPLVIYGDLSRFFEGVNGLEAQEEHCFNKLAQLQEQFLSCPSFPLFVTAMQNHSINTVGSVENACFDEESEE